MTTCLERAVHSIFLNVCQFACVLLSLLVSGVGCRILLYKFLINAILSAQSER